MRTTYRHNTVYSPGPPDMSEPYHDTETEVCIFFECTFGTEPIIHAAPEKCDPGSGDEIEVTNVRLKCRTIGNRYRWFQADDDEFDVIEAWTMENLHDDLVFAAREQESEAEERAREHEAEVRRDTQRL